jgi:hypothetical protein
VASDGKTFLSVGFDGIGSSNDGIHWTTLSDHQFAGSNNRLFWDGREWVGHGISLDSVASGREDDHRSRTRRGRRQVQLS